MSSPKNSFCLLFCLAVVVSGGCQPIARSETATPSAVKTVPNGDYAFITCFAQRPGVDLSDVPLPPFDEQADRSKVVFSLVLTKSASGIKLKGFGIFGTDRQKIVIPSASVESVDTSEYLSADMADGAQLEISGKRFNLHSFEAMGLEYAPAFLSDADAEDPSELPELRETARNPELGFKYIGSTGSVDSMSFPLCESSNVDLFAASIAL